MADEKQKINKRLASLTFGGWDSGGGCVHGFPTFRHWSDRQK
jgi:hypothetical protein